MQCSEISKGQGICDILIIGGKWTDRLQKIARDTIGNAILVGKQKASPCIYDNSTIFGYDKNLNLAEDSVSIYGTEKQKIINLEAENHIYGDIISES